MILGEGGGYWINPRGILGFTEQYSVRVCVCVVVYWRSTGGAGWGCWDIIRHIGIYWDILGHTGGGCCVPDQDQNRPESALSSPDSEITERGGAE